MFCKYCGKQLAEVGQNCSHCGRDQGSLSSLDGYFGVLQAVKASESDKFSKSSDKAVLRDEHKEESKSIEHVQNENLAKIKEVLNRQDEQSKMFQRLSDSVKQMKIMMALWAVVCILICLITAVIMQTTYRAVKTEHDEVSQIAVKTEELATVMQTTYQSVQMVYESVQEEYEAVGQMAEKIEELTHQEPFGEGAGKAAGEGTEEQTDESTEEPGELTNESLGKLTDEGIEDTADEQDE